MIFFAVYALKTMYQNLRISIHKSNLLVLIGKELLFSLNYLENSVLPLPHLLLQLDKAGS